MDDAMRLTRPRTACKITARKKLREMMKTRSGSCRAKRAHCREGKLELPNGVLVADGECSNQKRIVRRRKCGLVSTAHR